MYGVTCCIFANFIKHKVGKTDMRRFFAAGALLLFAGIAHAADPTGSSKTPQQVTELYISTMTGNADDAKTLNDYLRPQYDGKDAFDPETIAGIMDDIAKENVEAMKNELASSDSATNDAIPAFVKTAADAIKRSKCHATGANVEPGEYIADTFIVAAEVDYECLVPDLKKALAPQMSSANGKITAADLAAMATTIDATPADKTVSGKFTLYFSDEHVWHTGSSEDVLDPIREDVMRIVDQVANVAHSSDPTGSSKTPQQVAELYISTMMGNVDDAKTLNDYLRPQYDGKDRFDIKAVAGMTDSMTKHVAEAIKNELGSSDSATNDAIPAFAQAAVDASKRSTCNATGVTVEPNTSREIEADFLADVHYECHVLDLRKALKPRITPEDRKITAARLAAMAAAINAAPADKILRARFWLVSDTQHIWYTDSPEDENVMDVMDEVIEDAMRTVR